MFTLSIRTDNAAFEDEPAIEVARILRDTANHIEQNQPLSGTMRDINGNVVGSFNYNPF